METVTIYYWRQGKWDTRQCASEIGKLTVPQRGALARAREIVSMGDAKLSAVGGYPATIQYSSGHTRTINPN